MFVAKKITCHDGVLTRMRKSLSARCSGWLGLLAGAIIFGSANLSATGVESTQDSGIVSRIRREPVQSRALAAVGYSKRLRALEVEFKRGGTYRYLDVPPTVYHQLRAAESKAGFYNRHVRGKYRSVYVRPRRKR